MNITYARVRSSITSSRVLRRTRTSSGASSTRNRILRLCCSLYALIASDQKLESPAEVIDIPSFFAMDGSLRGLPQHAEAKQVPLRD